MKNPEIWSAAISKRDVAGVVVVVRAIDEAVVDVAAVVVFCRRCSVLARWWSSEEPSRR